MAAVVVMVCGPSSVALRGFPFQVQTPLKVTTAETQALGVGDPVLVRPAKAGEIAERFNSYVLTDGAQKRVVGVAQTYRGLGHAFY